MASSIQEMVRRGVDLLLDRSIQVLFNRTSGVDPRHPNNAPKISFTERLMLLLVSEFREVTLHACFFIAST